MQIEARETEQLRVRNTEVLLPVHIMVREGFPNNPRALQQLKVLNITQYIGKR